MTLYVPGGTENTITDTYLRQFWSQSCGYSGWCGAWQRQPEPGWHPDPSFTEVDGGIGTHGGCYYCIMTLSQVIANYQTEVTFVSNPPGAQIFIDGTEWWPGTITAADGATFRGIPPATDPTHTYELRMAGYRSAMGTFGLALGTPITVTGNLVPLGVTTINIVPNKTSCTELCDVSIDITWTNDANIDQTFTPSLTIDGNPITSVPYPSETLAAGVSVTHTFAISGLTKGSHTICPDPN